MKHFHIEVSWIMTATIQIEAESKEKAIEKVDNVMDKEALPKDAVFSKGSYEIDYVGEIQ